MSFHLMLFSFRYTWEYTGLWLWVGKCNPCVVQSFNTANVVVDTWGIVIQLTKVNKRVISTRIGQSLLKCGERHLRLPSGSLSMPSREHWAIAWTVLPVCLSCVCLHVQWYSNCLATVLQRGCTWFYPGLCWIAASINITFSVSILWIYSLIVLPVDCKAVIRYHTTRTYFCAVPPLQVIDLKEKSFAYFDSMGGDNHACQVALKDWLVGEAKDKKGLVLDLAGWKIVTPKVRRTHHPLTLDTEKHFTYSRCMYIYCAYR